FDKSPPLILAIFRFGTIPIERLQHDTHNSGLRFCVRPHRHATPRLTTNKSGSKLRLGLMQTVSLSLKTRFSAPFQPCGPGSLAADIRQRTYASTSRARRVW